MSNNLSTALALSAAALFLGACDKSKSDTTTPAEGTEAAAAASDAKIKCFGANDCTAQGACDVPDDRVEPGSKGHACAGQNECKGKGWVLKTTADCETAGGEPL